MQISGEMTSKLVIFLTEEVHKNLKKKLLAASNQIYRQAVSGVKPNFY